MNANSILTVSELYAPGDGDDEDVGDIVGVYELRFGDVNFGQLYITEETYAIVWPGKLGEFRFANDNASHFIFKQRDSDRRKLKLNLGKYDTRVTLVVSGKLSQFRFGSFEKPDDYQQLLSVPSEITFARYDFECYFEGERPAARYAFSIENAEAKRKDNGEMALLLPRTHPLAMGLLREWADKHIHARELKHALRETAVYAETYHALMRFIGVRW